MQLGCRLDVFRGHLVLFCWSNQRQTTSTGTSYPSSTIMVSTDSKSSLPRRSHAQATQRRRIMIMKRLGPCRESHRDWRAGRSMEEQRTRQRLHRAQLLSVYCEGFDTINFHMQDVEPESVPIGNGRDHGRSREERRIFQAVRTSTMNSTSSIATRNPAGGSRHRNSFVRFFHVKGGVRGYLWAR
jgi:hypothetical protein